MKNILTALVLTALASAASAQVSPNATQNALTAIKLRNMKIDTTALSKLTAPALTPNNLFIQQPVAANFSGNPMVVYSTMPVAHRYANKSGSVAPISGSNYNMPVKRVIVVAPKR